MLRSILTESFWVLFDVAFFVASLGLGIPAHALAHTGHQARMTCRMGQGESEAMVHCVKVGVDHQDMGEDFKCAQIVGILFMEIA